MKTFWAAHCLNVCFSVSLFVCCLLQLVDDLQCFLKILSPEGEARVSGRCCLFVAVLNSTVIVRIATSHVSHVT